MTLNCFFFSFLLLVTPLSRRFMPHGSLAEKHELEQDKTQS